MTDGEKRAAGLYAVMGTDELADLRAAFELDIAHATRPESVAFVRGRIALIAFEFEKRLSVRKVVPKTPD